MRKQLLKYEHSNNTATPVMNLNNKKITIIGLRYLVADNVDAIHVVNTI